MTIIWVMLFMVMFLIVRKYIEFKIKIKKIQNATSKRLHYKK